MNRNSHRAPLNIHTHTHKYPGSVRIHVLGPRHRAGSAHRVGAHVDDDVLLVSPSHRLLNLLEKNLGDPSTQGVHRLQKLQLQRVVHRLKQIVLKGKIPDGFIKRSESGLFVVVVDTPVAMQNRHAFPFSLFAVASIHAMVRAVVPLAGEHIETLWVVIKNNI